ncbi:ABC transporter substrate-binding protein [Donghicola tyrosinivorans]|uniref:Probable sugar-binding periplasmic protein n=1 Tax=Donghicola tyrosinivorans TaxID=1652492 RepID=A0A2T0WU49_9RHOB|nr:ABC transporter substrate-binding protein [Donghicola tyrosinivorans]PRY90226.1 glucose/mannose transport system substrate-binding protein [Donghicola tyrosinivorans]
MKTQIMRRLMAGAAALAMPIAANAADLEVTHWWTSGGEANAVQELAKAFEAKTDHKWVDGAIAGSGNTARPVIISRIIGGDPMAATQLNHGKQAQELIEAGLMLDLTDIAEEGNWAEIIQPKSLLDACTVDGRVYCVPLNIHSIQWMWTSNAAFEKAGIDPVNNWEELKAAAPKLREAGILPLAMGAQGWQEAYLVHNFLSGTSEDLYYAVYRDKDEDTLNSDAVKAVFEELNAARDMYAGGNVQDWNLATAKVINGEAAAQVMGDWAQGEFALAGQKAGEDYNCLIGMGGEPSISTGGDAFYFPLIDNADTTAAQKELAKVLISPESQVAFNLKKGSLPVRGDVDLAAAGPCMQKGLETLAAGKVITGTDQLITPDAVGQIQDLMAEFFGSDMSTEDAHAAFVEIILNDE